MTQAKVTQRRRYAIEVAGASGATTRRSYQDRHGLTSDADGSVVLTAANGAADWNPDWIHNVVVADQRVEVEVDGVQSSAHATLLEGDDRTTAWPTARQAIPCLELAQRESTRDIPLIRVTIG